MRRNWRNPRPKVVARREQERTQNEVRWIDAEETARYDGVLSVPRRVEYTADTMTPSWGHLVRY